jgi:transposase, IS30 family
MHKQLTRDDRAVLAQLLDLKLQRQQIAKRLGVHRTTVYRELKRNSGPVGYQVEDAQQRTDLRRWVGRTRKMEDGKTREYVCSRLQQQWSPDQIAGRSQLDFPRDPKHRLSRQTIYAWIDQQKAHRHPEWRDCLRFGKSRRKRSEKENRLMGAVSIDGRPRVVDLRRRFGDWEGDTIVSRGRRGGVVSLVERKSGYTLLRRVDDLKAGTVREALEHNLAPLPDLFRRTATFDNGSEFAEHQRLADTLDMNVYFAKPYSAWQRGTNENTNGLVRQYWAKGTDLTVHSHRAVAAVQALLNDRPRKRLGYRTPCEVVTQYLKRYRVAFGS